MSDDDFGLALKERMTRAADDITATPEILGEVRERYARRRRRQNWATVVGVLIAVAAIVIPLTVTGGGSDPKPAHHSEPAWARRCFDRQEQIFHAQLRPAPQYVGMTVRQAWGHLTAGHIKTGTIVAWNGKCAAFDGGEHGPGGRELFIAVVGAADPRASNVAANSARVVAARIAEPCPRTDFWKFCE
ncbi:MAG TPA: hypothetical protein VHC49_20570 [Mycobacteriales bacterium]|nr:hypothetical protein [Mycobacteriales bacterium]